MTEYSNPLTAIIPEQKHRRIRYFHGDCSLNVSKFIPNSSVTHTVTTGTPAFALPVNEHLRCARGCFASVCLLRGKKRRSTTGSTEMSQESQAFTLLFTDHDQNNHLPQIFILPLQPVLIRALPTAAACAASLCQYAHTERDQLGFKRGASVGQSATCARACVPRLRGAARCV